MVTYRVVVDCETGVSRRVRLTGAEEAQRTADAALVADDDETPTLAERVEALERKVL